MSLPVSIVLLTYNEERDIGECIQSVKEISNDIHVLDSFSTDRTLDVVRSENVNIHQNKFTGFGDQRNWAIDRIPTQYPWQLHLDADERATPEFIRELETTLASQPSHAGFWIPNRLMFGEQWLKYSSGYPVYQVRLFHRDRLRFTNAGHGQKECTTGTLGYFKSPYLHFGFSKGLLHWFEKHSKYAAQEAVQASEARRPLLVNLKDLFRDRVTRRRALKNLSYRVPCRPWLRWLEILVLRRGILDGKAGLLYAQMLYTYEKMTSIYINADRMGIESLSCRSQQTR